MWKGGEGDIMDEVSTHQQMLASMYKRSDTSSLDAATNTKYIQAASYYTVKKQAFLRKINSTKNQDIDQAELDKKTLETLESSYRYITELWNKIDSLIYDLVVNDKSYISYGQKVSNAIQLIAYGESQNLNSQFETYKIGKENFEIVQNIFKNQGEKINEILKTKDKEYINNTIASILGQVFEPFAAEAINSFASACGQVGQNCINTLLDGFSATGDKRISIKTATKQANKQISPDIAFGVTDENKNSVELSFEQNAEIKNMMHNYLNTNMMNDTIGQQLYEQINSGNSEREQMFGFSLKRWKDGDQNKAYTSSSVIQSQLNQIFNTEKTWNYKYAFARAQLELAKNAIALFGPINIGVFTTHGFTWMDDFIKNRRLFMNIYSRTKPKYGEIKPYINSGSIYIHDYNKSKQDAIKYKNYGKDEKTKKPYYKISFKAALNKY